MPERIGFVGLGIMGKPMAQNLMESGFELVLHNRTRRKAEALAAEAGVQVADSPGEVAERSNITITMLPARPRSSEFSPEKRGFLREPARVRSS
jgi:2-hydroxy-3-oxopropionate reductase